VAGRTGLHFKYVGPTGLLYLGDHALEVGPDIVVAWSNASGVLALAGGIVGLGGGWALPVGADVANQIVSGYVVLDRDALLTGGFTLGGMPTWGQVMEHEIGHAVGLGHAHGAQQVMFASVGADDHQFGAGDLAGLARAGAAAGCL
jgi:hypothetical protein